MPLTRRAATRHGSPQTTQSSEEGLSNNSSASDLAGQTKTAGARGRGTTTTATAKARGPTRGRARGLGPGGGARRGGSKRSSGGRAATGKSSGSSGSDEGVRDDEGRVTIATRRRASKDGAGKRPHRERPATEGDGAEGRKSSEETRSEDSTDEFEAIGAGDFEVVDFDACVKDGWSVSNIYGRRTRNGVAECYVRWAGCSHAKNSWVREDALEGGYGAMVEQFKAHNGESDVYLVDSDWLRPQRIVSTSGIPPDVRLLVKWWRLPYADCTWEALDGHEDFKRLLERYTQFDNENLNQPYHSPTHERSSSCEAVRAVAKWLVATWFEKEGVCFVDNSEACKHAEVAATFIAERKRQYNEKGPSLIILNESQLPAWSQEFDRVAPDLNVVEYGGSATCRTSVQHHEWSFTSTVAATLNDVAQPRFNVLLTTSSTAMLDIVLLRQVRWESVILVEHTRKLTAETSSLMSRLGSLSANHRALMFRSVDFCDLHVTLNILEFLKRAPSSMRNLEARLLNLSHQEACTQTAALLALVTMDYQHCQRALQDKQALSESDADMGVLHTARLLELSEIVLAQQAKKTNAPASRESLFPLTFDYTSSHYLSLLHHLQVLHDMYRPLANNSVPQGEMTDTQNQ